MTSVSAHAESSRAPHELRTVGIQANHVLTQANGSATFSFGHESALAAVHGPQEVRMRDELTDRATLSVDFLPLDGSAGISSSSFCTTVKETFSRVLLLHAYPRSLIQLTLQSTNHPTIGILPPTMHAIPLKQHQERARGIRPQYPHPDAQLGIAQQAALFNAATLALVAGGIQATATVCAVAVAIVPSEVARGVRRSSGGNADAREDGTLVLDPSPLEESVATGSMLCVYALSGSRIESTNEDMEVDGGVDLDLDLDSTADARLCHTQATGVPWHRFEECLRVARPAAARVRAEMRRALGVASASASASASAGAGSYS